LAPTRAPATLPRISRADIGAVKSRITPLWIVAAFVSLTETVLGYAVTKTTGAVQYALTAFVVFFALAVATAFFLVLWNRPYVFYAPSEYGSVDPKSFIDAVKAPASQERKDVLSEAQELLKHMIASGNETQRNSIAKNINSRLEIASEVQTAYELLLIPGYDVSFILEILVQIQLNNSVDADSIARPRGITPSTVEAILGTMANRGIVKRRGDILSLSEEGVKLMNALREYGNIHGRGEHSNRAEIA